MSDTSQNQDAINEQGSVFSLICRICYDADSNEELITPCRCKGTVAYVHRSCLETWLAEANATNCELCHQAFHTERTPKYTTCQSLWRWLRYQPTANEVGRGIIGDMLACAAITPMAVVITYVCLFSSDYYNQKKFQALTAAKWTSVSLLVMIGIMLVGYYMWVFSIIKLHMTVWYNWWQRECIVRYIAPTSNSRIAAPLRTTRRESSVITIAPSDGDLDTTEFIDVETVNSKPRMVPSIRPIPKPHKPTSSFFLGKKRILPTIEERESETVINIVQSSSRNLNLFLTSTSRVVMENEELDGGKNEEEKEESS
ncbi:E3 ubiquitin-protein ligase MARCHF3-like [Coccinella septempunctata]|uniref:E3 ubiquitin-protein ligase MARCHF3-like n=1 Tax=Coccinella septempunctata TaxID=41139 RepID=UPI001D08A8D2|nr:E3 ubiquitin-protein ligase MARCHF3-like [Coccinella septempunctata]